ncbi:MAG TPA: hypothetical protein VM074_09900 [Solimonas sp.]|nr:hypothetical protein [Solimonas sp.]
MRIRRLLALLLIGLPVLALARGAELTEPSVALPHGRTPADALAAVKAAAITQGWTVQGEDASGASLALFIRSHVASVRAQLQPSAVSLLYVGSENLAYASDGGVRTIHANYNKWVGALAADIGKFLAEGVPDAAALAAMRGAKGRPAARNANPAPTEALGNFSRFELKAVAPGSQYLGGDDALAEMRTRVADAFAPRLAEWNARPAPAQPRTLRIEPVLERIRFVGNGARIFLGGMAGRSWAVLRVRFVDAATGNVVAEPELFERSGRGNGFSGAAADYRMLTAVAEAAAGYAAANFVQPIGGGVRPPPDLE